MTNIANSNYDIWAIQNYPEEVVYAIEGLEDSKDNVLYNNCKSYIRVGERRIYVQFDTALVCEDKERLILLKKDGLLMPDHFRGLLNRRRIPYNEVTYIEGKPIKQKDTKEIWFAVDNNVLTAALKDSKKKGVEACEYFPDLRGCLELRNTVDDGSLVTFYRQTICGAMVLEDKIVLLMSYKNKRNITYPQVLDTIYKNDMASEVTIGARGLPIEQLPKQYKKGL